mgnify:CR=1 FL=1
MSHTGRPVRRLTRNCAERLYVYFRRHRQSQRASVLLLPTMSSTVPVGALVGWMLLLTAKHIVADFFLQNSWMAIGKDQRKGWALPLLAHCLVHLAVALPLILIVAPRFWFVAFIDFAIHITIDRAKGFVTSHFGVNQEHPWFWSLIGVDQALHHLTGFGLSIFMAQN